MGSDPRKLRAESSAQSIRGIAPRYTRSVADTYTAVIERCLETGLYVGFVPGISGAHSQGETLEELNCNLKEVVTLLLEENALVLATEYVGTQTVALT